jgi:hypothetical protein
MCDFYWRTSWLQVFSKLLFPIKYKISGRVHTFWGTFRNSDDAMQDSYRQAKRRHARWLLDKSAVTNCVSIFLFYFIYNLNQQSEFTFYKLMLWLLQCLDGESSSGESTVPQIRPIGQFFSRLFSSLTSSVLRGGFSWVSNVVRCLLHFWWMASCTYDMPRSACSVALETYHGASTIILMILDLREMVYNRINSSEIVVQWLFDLNSLSERDPCKAQRTELYTVPKDAAGNIDNQDENWEKCRPTRGKENSDSICALREAPQSKMRIVTVVASQRVARRNQQWE